MIVVTGVARIIRRVNGPASMVQLFSGSRACVSLLTSQVDFLLVLCFCLIFGLEFNIINYLWFSGVRLFFYYLGSLIGWLPVFIGIQLRFYFYLYGLEFHYFFSVFSKIFYVGMLIWLNILGGESFFCLRYLFVSFTLLNYLLVRGIYFFSFSVLGQYYFALSVCLVYALVFHEFSFFSLVIGFPVALVFYLKFSCLFLGCYFVACLFLIPIVLSVQLGNFPMFEETFISFLLLMAFI